MAKDVDLNSKEWRDIVFEGKNKEYGAYQLRATTPARHTRAVIIVLGVLAVIVTLLALSLTGVFGKADDEGADANTEQELAVLDTPEDEEIEDEEIIEIEQPEEEEIIQEQAANEQAVTNILVVDDKDFDETKQAKEQDKVMDNEAQFGTVDFSDGVNDLNKQVIKEQVVQEVKPVVEEKVYTVNLIEQEPTFPGGESAMRTWLSNHIEYPAAAAEEGIQGKVTVNFTVGKDGSITNVKAVRGPHPALNREAERVVKAMPKWIPGKNNGQPVKVSYNLPIQFRLQQ